MEAIRTKLCLWWERAGREVGQAWAGDRVVAPGLTQALASPLAFKSDRGFLVGVLRLLVIWLQYVIHSSFFHLTFIEYCSRRWS